ncbi:MAG: carbohydrate binding family 9 domain-containing protein, partial [Gemmatimonadota bacterium]
MKRVIFSFLLTFAVLSMIFSEMLSANDAKDVEVHAIRLEEPVVVDGILSETVWNNGSEICDFIQRDPDEGSEPTERTEVRVAYDDDALYVGARMYDSAPDSIIARLGRRDQWPSADFFRFYIDPYYDRRSGFYFGLNAAGTCDDGILYNDEWSDDSWDGVWQGKVNIDNKGWTAEMRIPYSQLRFQKRDRYLWGINFRRCIERKNEHAYVVYTPKDGSGFVSRFVDLVGIENIHPARQVEILPYTRLKAEYVPAEPDDPFNDGSRYPPDMGADFKIGLGNNLILDATVNPDFGQVEVDPAVINLGDVETFYSEKRPFFIEGSSIFEFGYGGSRSHWSFNWGGPNFFYSRRIGRCPQGSLPDHDWAQIPEGTQILGATKLTGKIGNNWNIGTLHALTGRGEAKLDISGHTFRAEVEPLTYYGVARAQKEIDEGKQGLGFISTFTTRMFRDDRLRDEFNSGARTFGLDGWTFLDSERRWVISSWVGLTHVRGSKERMLSLQESSGHYFQRPDASHVSVDSSATSLSGYGGRILVNKQKGNVIFNSSLGVIHPNFDLNDMGFMWRTDVINGHLGGGYKWTKPGKYTRYVSLIGAVFQNYDYGWNNTWR